MTFALLAKIIRKKKIPKDVRLMSDSGWEGFATKMNGVYYSSRDNTIIFTQRGGIYEKYSQKPGYECLYGEKERDDG